MGQTILVSNRLPVTISFNDQDIDYQQSLGGLATGLSTIHKADGSLWIGWNGLKSDELQASVEEEINSTLLRNHKCVAVSLKGNDVDEFYFGFCNKTIWPLFHYFINKAEYNHDLWKAYVRINRIFFETLEKHIKPDSQVWVHDYQLMLLPKMIKEAYPDTQVGFFLHIPFPSYEIFRLLPWRKKILEGILGSDLIGFHTYDYVRHFLSATRRILNYENHLGLIDLPERTVKTDIFPMGIDYKKYAEAHMRPEVQKEIEKFVKQKHGRKTILSVDRLDYSKGIPERIKAFDRFLELYPDYKEKVALIVIAAPSRVEVESYIELRKEVEGLVSQTNGRHGRIGWVPIWFFYQSFSFDNLTALYAESEVLLVTPLRDGMNLVAKEYIATRSDKKGVVVLSETAGAACELSESLVVNANSIYEIAQAIKKALEMPVDEQIAANTVMHERLQRYTVENWANDFMDKLSIAGHHNEVQPSRYLEGETLKDLQREYSQSKKRLLILDYDGTLTPFFSVPSQASPTKELKALLLKLANDDNNEVAIISGRDKDTLEQWLGDLPVHLIAGHGVWIRYLGEPWNVIDSFDKGWKEVIRPILLVHADRTPGSLVEEKEFSLAWHYRRCEPELAEVRLSELREILFDYTHNLEVGLLEGNKVIEVKDKAVNKGRAAKLMRNRQKWDFIFCAGDDVTDEDMFQALAGEAHCIKIGSGTTAATEFVRDVEEFLGILKEFSLN